MTLRLDNGNRFAPNANSEVRCDTHGIVTTWGALDSIQQLAVEEGLDVDEDLTCLLDPSRTATV